MSFTRLHSCTQFVLLWTENAKSILWGALVVSLLLMGAGTASAQVSVRLPDTTGVVGNTETIPIQVGDLTGKGILSFEFALSYDADTLSIVGVETSGTLASDLNVIANTDNVGEVTVSAGGTQALSGEGTLLKLEVRYKDRGRSPMEWTEFQFNEGTPGADTSSGAVTVQEPPPGDITVRLPKTTGEVGDSTTVPVTVSDTDGPYGSGVLSFDFTFSYNSSLVTVDTVTTEGTLTDSWTVESNTSEPGKVSVSAGNTETLRGQDSVLVNVELSYEAEGTSSLKWQQFQFNEGDPTAELVDGKATVTEEGTLPPSKPTGLSAEPDDGVVELTWAENSEDDIAGYNIYRSTAPFSEISGMTPINGSTVVQAISYTDQDTEPGTTYYYRITAVDSDGNESRPSRQTTASLQNLKLLGLEVNQSVQNWKNSVPLIEGKKTIVRAQIRGKSGPTSANVRLKGTRNGSPLSKSPLRATNGQSFEAKPLEEGLPYLIRERTIKEGSLNFRLPGEWTQRTITLELVGDGIDCTGAAAVGEDCTIQVDFEPIPEPKITFFLVFYTDDSGTVQPPEVDINAAVQRLKAMYPVNDISKFPTRQLPISSSGVPSGQTVLEKLRAKWENDVGTGRIDSTHIYFGFVQEVSKISKAGEANGIPGKVAFASTHSEAGNPYTTTAHEIGHLLGLQHAVNEEDNETGIFGYKKLGYCGSESTPDSNPPDFPYSIPSPFPNTWNGFAGIGTNRKEVDEEIWGINTQKMKVRATRNLVRGGETQN